MFISVQNNSNNFFKIKSLHVGKLASPVPPSPRHYIPEESLLAANLDEKSAKRDANVISMAITQIARVNSKEVEAKEGRQAHPLHTRKTWDN